MVCLADISVGSCFFFAFSLSCLICYVTFFMYNTKYGVRSCHRIYFALLVQRLSKVQCNAEQNPWHILRLFRQPSMMARHFISWRVEAESDVVRAWAESFQAESQKLLLLSYAVLHTDERLTMIVKASVTAPSKSKWRAFHKAEKFQWVARRWPEARERSSRKLAKS